MADALQNLKIGVRRRQIMLVGVGIVVFQIVIVSRYLAQSRANDDADRVGRIEAVSTGALSTAAPTHDASPRGTFTDPDVRGTAQTRPASDDSTGAQDPVGTSDHETVAPPPDRPTSTSLDSTATTNRPTPSSQPPTAVPPTTAAPTTPPPTTPPQSTAPPTTAAPTTVTTPNTVQTAPPRPTLPTMPTRPTRP